MKNQFLTVTLLFFIASLGFAQKNAENEPNKDKTFAKVENLLSKAQPNAAQKELWKILSEAKKEKNELIPIQAFYYFNEVLNPLESEERAQLYFKLFEIAKDYPEPTKSLLKVQLLQEFTFNNYEWFGFEHLDIYDSIDFANKDVKFNFVLEHLQELEGEITSLQKYKFEDYQKALPPVEDTLFLYRNLSDYMAYQLIDIYQSNFIRMDSPLKNAGTDSKSWYGTPKDFIALSLKENNLTSTILRLHQYLEKNNSEFPDFQSVAVYLRLNYLNDQFKNNKEIKLAWQRQFDFYKATSARSKFLFELAKIKHNEGLTYHYKVNPKVENRIKEAYDELQAELKLYPKNDFKEEIATLIEKIETQEISFKFPNIVTPNNQIPVLITHRNYAKHFIRIYRINDFDPLEINSLRGYAKGNQLELIQTQELELKEKGQFQKRTTEILLKAITEPGQYFFVASENNKDFHEYSLKDKDKEWNQLKLYSNQFSVADIAVSGSYHENVYSILVVNQKTGEPIKDAEVNLYYQDYKKGNNSLLYKSGKTNKDGLAIFPYDFKEIGNRSISYVVKHGKSVLYGNNYLYQTINSEESSFAKIVTDRSIYRPGQTVYFKVIGYQGKENNFTVLSNEKIKINILDANYQNIYNETFTTNEWGSFDGSFSIPKNLTLGDFTINAQILSRSRVANYSSVSFSVEEYKRPTYEVTLNMPKDEAKLDADVQITGNAKAFAGFPISNAQVTYSVYRTWNRNWVYWQTTSNEDLLKEGNLVTDSDGNFTIDFFAETDPNATKFAYYNYEVRVKVTDISGETHEKTLSLPLSKTGLSLQANVPSRVLTNQDGIITTKVVNLAGEEQKGFNGTVEIFKKVTSDRFLNRLWDNAETSHFSEDDFKKLFPNMRLNVYEDYPELIKVKTVDFKIGDTLYINKLVDKNQGDFIFKFYSLTKEGDTLKSENGVEIIDVSAKTLPAHESLWTYVSSYNIEVGETLNFQVGSSFKNAKALVSFYRGKELVSQEWVNLKNRHSINYKVVEKDRGALSYHVILFNNGKLYFETDVISVPFSNKALQIKTATFRDKLEPGQKEKWSFTIQDNKNNFVKSELAATMYDASLDQIRSHNWLFSIYRAPSLYINWSKDWSQYHLMTGSTNYNWRYNDLLSQSDAKYQSNFISNRFYGFNSLETGGYTFGMMNKASLAPITIVEESENMSEMDDAIADIKTMEEKSKEHSAKAEEKNAQEISPRSNFNETAFFYPFIYSNSENEYVLDFTLPESLTKWNLLLLAHTKEMQIGSTYREIEAKKDFMVTANSPRFLREGDIFNFSAKVVNLTENDQMVNVSLELKNPETGKELNLIQGEIEKSIIVPANSSAEVNWRLQITNLEMIQYTISASNKVFSDGERNIIPVLSNRVFLTETDHFLIKEKGKGTYNFKSFEGNNSKTIDNKTFTVEYIDNLAWQAVLALPYLSKNKDESSTSLIDKYYANAIAEYIVNSRPKIKEIFEQWKLKSPEAFLSELEKNEDLKNVLLQETPWVLEAKSEAEQRRRIGQLFEINQLQFNQQHLFSEIEKKQNYDGGFAWFDGGKSSVYITQYMITRLGKLKNLGIATPTWDGIINDANNYLANEQIKWYNKHMKTAKDKKNYSVYTSDIHWLYANSFLPTSKNKSVEEIKEFYTEKLKSQWTTFNPQVQAMIGIYFKKEGLTKEASKIYASLLDRAKKNSSVGMYWVENSGWYWHDNKISSQAMILTFLKEMNASDEILDDTRLWLILNKESNAWETGTETAEAIYAILSTGKDYLKDSPQSKISIGKKQFVTETPKNSNEIQVEFTPGLGQMQYKWTGEEISKDLGTVSIEKFSEAPAVLNFYWQYTEVLSNVKASENPSISIQKNYKRVVPGAKGETGIEGTEFSIGDKIEVELVVKVDRDMEFVHIKDLRPAGFEPSDMRSGYVWDKNFIYYQSPKDVSMEFFVENLGKGTYKLTYTAYATHSGNFNSGLATVQSYYAPKFSGHSGTKDVVIKR